MSRHRNVKAAIDEAYDEFGYDDDYYEDEDGEYAPPPPKNKNTKNKGGAGAKPNQQQNQQQQQKNQQQQQQQQGKGKQQHIHVPGSPLLSALKAGAGVQAAAEAGADLSSLGSLPGFSLAGSSGVQQQGKGGLHLLGDAPAASSTSSATGGIFSQSRGDAGAVAVPLTASAFTRATSTGAGDEDDDDNNDEVKGGNAHAAGSSLKIAPNTAAFNKKKATLVEEELKGIAKPNLHMVVIGHVDSGKSTLVGHLLFKSGRVSERQIKQFQHESRASGKSSFHFAWVLDQNEQERARGITVDVGLNWFETPQRRITVLDCPGHRDFVPNMISGAAQADVGILTISAAPGEFESGFMDNGQTREHAILAHSLGVRELIVAINKLDAAEPSWSKDRYDSILESLLPFLALTGFDLKKVYPIPISGFTGENLDSVSSPELKEWYSGPTLLQQIDSFETPPRASDKPFRMVVTDCFSTQAAGFCVSGKIDAGSVVPKERLLLAPLMTAVTVRSVEVGGVTVKAASAGESVVLGIKDVDDAQVMSGQVLCDVTAPVPLVSKFEAQIVANQSRKKVPLLPGVSVVLHTQSASESAVISKIIGLLAQDGTVLPKKSLRFVPTGSNALVEITITNNRKLCMEKYSDYRELGRFSLRKEDETVAVGIVTDLLTTHNKAPN